MIQVTEQENSIYQPRALALFALSYPQCIAYLMEYINAQKNLWQDKLELAGQLNSVLQLCEELLHSHEPDYQTTKLELLLTELDLEEYRPKRFNVSSLVGLCNQTLYRTCFDKSERFTKTEFETARNLVGQFRANGCISLLLQLLHKSDNVYSNMSDLGVDFDHEILEFGLIILRARVPDELKKLLDEPHLMLLLLSLPSLAAVLGEEQWLPKDTNNLRRFFLLAMINRRAKLSDILFNELQLLPEEFAKIKWPELAVKLIEYQAWESVDLLIHNFIPKLKSEEKSTFVEHLLSHALRHPPSVLQLLFILGLPSVIETLSKKQQRLVMQKIGEIGSLDHCDILSAQGLSKQDQDIALWMAYGNKRIDVAKRLLANLDSNAATALIKLLNVLLVGGENQRDPNNVLTEEDLPLTATGGWLDAIQFLRFIQKYNTSPKLALYSNHVLASSMTSNFRNFVYDKAEFLDYNSHHIMFATMSPMFWLSILAMLYPLVTEINDYPTLFIALFFSLVFIGIGIGMTGAVYDACYDPHFPNFDKTGLVRKPLHLYSTSVSYAEQIGQFFFGRQTQQNRIQICLEATQLADKKKGNKL